MKELQKLLSRARAAADKYNMIDEGDHIVACVSGGKDSIAMLCTLAAMREFYPKRYTLSALMIDPGFHLSPSIAATMSDHKGVRELCDRLGVPLVIKQTEIAKVIFDVRKESNPCSLCARMRRGIIHDSVIEMGARKLALGHHLDDAVETAMMNLFFNGNFECFSPVTYLSRKDLTMIRPMMMTEEKDIKSFVKKANLPVEKSPCPEDSGSERANMREYLFQFERQHRGLYARIIGALERGEISGWKE